MFMTTKKKRLFIIGGIAVAALLVLTVVFNLWFSTTRVAFVNYQVISLGEISKANENPSIKICELSVDDLDHLHDYDMVFINAMGIRITEEQRALIQEAANDGLPILTTAATNPANRIVSLDSIQGDTIRQYLSNGGRRNYRSMLNYVRKDIDKKLFHISDPEPVMERSNDMLYHKDPAHLDDEEIGFNSVADYNKFLREKGLWSDDAPRIVVTGLMGEPTDLIAQLESTGNVVYAVRSMNKFVKQHYIDSIQPSAIINMAHGRMGDYMVDYLKQQNIPLFAPLNVNRLVSEWEEDNMGMQGGFLSQSVVTPEIDGAIRPYALFGYYLDDEGLQHAQAIPDRLKCFVQTVNNYISLQRKENSEKKVAIYYYKGPGQSALTAAGMEVVPSLYNLLLRLKAEGYNVANLPSSLSTFNKFLTLDNSSEQNDFQLSTINYQLFGNIALIPQPLPGEGDDTFKIIHGTDTPPTQDYINSYLWVRNTFKADALIHFGTHGSLEFTPRKQVALGNSDWPDSLVGSLPHFYVYSIGDVGEGVIAKRRSYAGLQSHITPPFMESNMRNTYKELTEAIKAYNTLAEANSSPDAFNEASLKVKQLTVNMGIHRSLGLDSILSKPYTADNIQRIENFGEEVANEKITGQLYTMGQPYEKALIESSVYAMATDPIAYSLQALDKLRGKADPQLEKHKQLFTHRYLEPARQIVGQLLAKPSMATDDYVCHIAGITLQQLAQAREIEEQNKPKNMMEIMMSLAEEAPAEAKTHADMSAMSATHGKKMPEAMRKMMMKRAKDMKPEEAMNMARKMGASPEALKRMQAAMDTTTRNVETDRVPAPTAEDDNTARLSTAIIELERTLCNVSNYKSLLETTPETELSSLINALNGGYTAPSPGGDPIANPNTLPTGRNLFAINAEETPTETAWEKGKQLAQNTIAMYRRNHNDSLPRKVSYTLWSGEFIESGGATIAQVLYMLGVEPIRDTFGRVADIRLIPSEELGRPRVDVVVQTSGQLRDIAASRLFLINRAVEMAAASTGDKYENHVARGTMEAERVLVDKGLSPKEAREISAYRVFGGLNGGYGTGIQAMVNAGDRWDNEQEIADVYLNNMGAFYGSEKDWEKLVSYAFEAALTGTDAVVQPRQSNTWGALSLDHVYEFMGGMNLAVRNVTGKDPDAYLADYRNRNNVKMQDIKEAIGVESQTTLFNPTYIKEKMKGGSTSAFTFTELVQNTYGWNVMKPDAIDGEMWDEIYEVYIKDKHSLGVQAFFEKQSPASLEQITAVMMETARKGMWEATPEQLADIARLHTDLVNKYKPSASTSDFANAKLRDFIASYADPQAAAEYRKNIDDLRQEEAAKKGVVMKKEELNTDQNSLSTFNSQLSTLIVVVVAIAVLIVMVRRRRKQNREE